jgi:hypothetical protein
VPAAAVRRRGGKKVVFSAFNGEVLVREGRPAAQRADGLLVQGLDDGKSVITSDPQYLHEDEQIKNRGNRNAFGFSLFSHLAPGSLGWACAKFIGRN